ncbi:unnamed protein product [Discosporangium mesarthrocarpum]
MPADRRDDDGIEMVMAEEGRLRSVPVPGRGDTQHHGEVFEAISHFARLVSRSRRRILIAILIYAAALLGVLSLVIFMNTSSDEAFQGLNLAAIRWWFVAVAILSTSILLTRALHASLSHTLAYHGSRGGRLSRSALAERMRRRHPGMDVGRLSLLLSDRDFTGEDYQALLELDNNNVVPSTVGATDAEIRRNPSFLFGPVKEPTELDSKHKPRSCPVCLYEFQPQERVRIIPCLHQFHTECIDPWLRQNAICPVCKFPAVG